jgi:uncharacterized protein
MIAYVDASVILRLVLGEPARLAEWSSIKEGITSELAEVECLRTLDRLRLRGALTDPELAARRAAVFELMEELTLVAVTRPVLTRAAHPFPTPLGTFDAIHLATALLLKDRAPSPPAFATHDAALSQAARSCGLHVLGP